MWHYSILPGTLPCNCNYFWKPSLSYMLLFSNASNFKLWNTIYILQTMWLVIFYSGMPSKLCFIKTLYTSHRLQSHLSFCFLWGWGFGTLILTLNHYFQNEEGIFWNIFNVTALVLLLCLYDGKSCFACLFSFKRTLIWSGANSFLLRPNIIIRCPIIIFWSSGRCWILLAIASVLDQIPKKNVF